MATLLEEVGFSGKEEDGSDWSITAEIMSDKHRDQSLACAKLAVAVCFGDRHRGRLVST
jgi:hypothetical protein